MKKAVFSKIILSFLIITVLVPLVTAYSYIRVNASDQPKERKTVRVGWYDSSFNHVDKYGRRSGYAYDYQQKIADYTGWDYEYVEGSWTELFDMLKNGEIDLMSDVSYTDERAQEMLFPSYSMGAESYYLFVKADNNEIRPGQYNTLDGKKIGINRGSFQEKLFIEWAEKNGVNAGIVPLDGSEEESLERLANNEIDAYLTLNATWDMEELIPIEKIGESEYFFVVNKERPDLLDDLNYALSRIQDKNLYFNNDLYDKYSTGSGARAFLDHTEAEWCAEHGTIRVGYLDDRRPFCDYDETSGEMVGALAEFLKLAKDVNRNTTLTFESKPYKSTEKAITALRSGEIDCVFPVNMTPYDGEIWELLITDPVMQTEVYSCVRIRDHVTLTKDAKMRITTINGDINDALFIRESFPDCTVVHCKDTEECFSAVNRGTADAALISSYWVASTEELREKYSLSAHTTGQPMLLSFAVNRDDTVLYSVLDNSIDLVPITSIESSLATYSALDEKETVVHFIKKNLWVVIVIILITGAISTALLIRRSRRMKTELEERLALRDRIIVQESEKLEADKVINALSTDYRSIYYVDLDRDSAICYRANYEIRGGVQEGDQFTFSSRFTEYARDYISESDRTGFLDFIKPQNIKESLKKEPLVSYRFLANLDDSERYELIRMARVSKMSDSRDDSIREICVGLMDVDSETRKELEKNTVLSEALNLAEDASAAKTAFLSSMSHEIRTPMNAIIGLNKIALSKPDLPDDVREDLEKISSSADHLLHLINNILDMSRIESGRLILRNEEFSLRDMLGQINTMIDSQCQDKGLTYSCRIQGDVDYCCIGDDMKLKQVLLNILGNAVKYTPAPGTVTFTVETLHRYDENAGIRFVIEDTGIGMDEEFLPKVFDVFEQEDENRANKYGSTGLGMTIAKRIVEMMNGNIEVESKKGLGTKFTVTVTLRVSDKSGALKDTSVRPQDLHVLIIDDDPDGSAGAKAVLDEVGISSESCLSGSEAYDLLSISEARQEAYNLILVDWKMPEEDGVEVTRQIRKRLKDDAAIIILTAYDWEDIEQEAIEAGVDGFMTKPLFASNVLDELNRIIASRKYNKKESKKADLNGRRILMAEDMEINAEIMKALLGLKGIETDHAENGQIAVDMFKASPEGTYDAILMDVRMPVMDGLTATEVIRDLDRSDAKTIPIIAMTANAFDEDVQRSLQAGLNAHLSKPVEPDLLYETLESMIAE